jgi:hypothetical protein
LSDKCRWVDEEAVIIEAREDINCQFTILREQLGSQLAKHVYSAIFWGSRFLAVREIIAGTPSRWPVRIAGRCENNRLILQFSPAADRAATGTVDFSLTFRTDSFLDELECRIRGQFGEDLIMQFLIRKYQ